MTDVLELYIIEIPKAREILRKEPNNELAQWVMFLNDPNESEVSKIMEHNKEIEEAMNELERISSDKELRRVAELREKAIRDEKNGIRYAKEEGKIEGKIEVVRKMLKKVIDIDTICELTGIIKEEILKLKLK